MFHSEAYKKTLTVLAILFLFSSLVIGLVQLPTAKATSYELGHNAIGSNTGEQPPNKYIATKFTATDSGSTNVVGHIYDFTDYGSTMKFMVYSDNAGVPNTLLLTSSAIATTHTAWSSFPLSDYSFVSGTTYWLCAVSGSGNWGSNYDSGSSNQYAEISTGSFTPPNPFGTPDNLGPRMYSIYLTYDSAAPAESALTANPSFDFTMASNSTAYYIIAKNGTFVYNDGSPTTVLSQIATYANNSKSAYINSSFTESTNTPLIGLNNVTFAFDPSSIITMGNNVGNTVAYTAILDFRNCTKITVVNATLNGNSANQGGLGSHTQGLSFYDCNNSLATGVNITQVRMFGFNIWDSIYHNSNNGIINSTVTHSGWNDIQISTDNNTIGSYAINNIVGYCSDVGIATYGFNTLIRNNTVLAVNGTTGGGGSANYGIAVEDGAYNQIYDNSVNGTKLGIVLGTGWVVHSNLVTNNTVTKSRVAIEVDGSVTGSSNFNVVTRNIVSNWHTGGGAPAINLNYAFGTIVSFNTLTNLQTDGDGGININNLSNNNTICNNTIALSNTNNDDVPFGFSVFSGNNTLVQGNTFSGCFFGTYIGNTAFNTKLNQNAITNANLTTLDNGVGTITNPSSSPTYTLTLCNTFDGSAKGTYVYSNTTALILTTSGVLNVDGTNVTSPYAMSMNKDHFAYEISNSLVLTNEPEPTPTPGGPTPSSSPNPFISGIADNFYGVMSLFVICLIIFAGSAVIGVVMMVRTGRIEGEQVIMPIVAITVTSMVIIIAVVVVSLLMNALV